MWCTVMSCIVPLSDLLRCYDWFCYCSALSPSLSLSIVIPTLTAGVKARCRVLSCRRLYSIVELRYVVRAPSPCANRDVLCCIVLSSAIVYFYNRYLCCAYRVHRGLVRRLVCSVLLSALVSCIRLIYAIVCRSVELCNLLPGLPSPRTKPRCFVL